jgi:hypothetical protein
MDGWIDAPIVYMQQMEVMYVYEIVCMYGWMDGWMDAIVVYMQHMEVMNVCMYVFMDGWMHPVYVRMYM